MANKNDLSAYQQPTRGVLTADKEPKQRKGRAKAAPPRKERRDRKVLLSFTPTEEALIKEQAGLVPVATYLVAKLREAGVIPEAG